MTQQYETCRSQLQKDDELIQKLQVLVSSLKDSRTELEKIIADYENKDTVYDGLSLKYEMIIGHTAKIESLYEQNQHLCTESVGELKAAIIALNKEYNQAVKDCLRPFYLRWSFWSGLGLGILLGLL